MALFTTAREKRLWCWIAVVMLAIYSTLGPARTLADYLRARGLLRLAFGLLVVVLLVAVLRSWLRRQPGRSEFGVMIGVGLVYVWTFARMTTPEERTHLIEYGVIAALVHQAFEERRRGGGRVKAPAITAIIVTIALGWIDEAIQSQLPGRTYDLRDVGFNTLAALTVVIARVALKKARERGGGQEEAGSGA